MLPIMVSKMTRTVMAMLMMTIIKGLKIVIMGMMTIVRIMMMSITIEMIIVKMILYCRCIAI